MAARRVRPGPLGLRRMQFWQAAPKCAVQTASPRQPARNKSPPRRVFQTSPSLARAQPTPSQKIQLAIRHHQPAPCPAPKPRRVARKQRRVGGRVGLGEGNTAAESLASSSSTAKPPSRSLLRGRRADARLLPGPRREGETLAAADLARARWIRARRRPIRAGEWRTTGPRTRRRSCGSWRTG